MNEKEAQIYIDSVKQLEREIAYNLEQITYHAMALDKLRIANNQKREKIRQIENRLHDSGHG